MFAVIDCEGTYFTTPKGKSFYSHEIGIAIFNRRDVVHAYTRKINYDIQKIYNLPENIRLRTELINKGFHRWKPIQNQHTDYQYARRHIINLIKLYKIEDALYAKGRTFEMVWLFNPKWCHGQNRIGKAKIIDKLGKATIKELEHFKGFPKYNNIPTQYKAECIRKVNWMLVSHDYPNLNRDLITHLSMLECIVFGFKLIQIKSAGLLKS